jgi:hypothetical protein
VLAKSQYALLLVPTPPQAAYMLHEAGTEILFVGRGHATRTLLVQQLKCSHEWPRICANSHLSNTHRYQLTVASYIVQQGIPAYSAMINGGVGAGLLDDAIRRVQEFWL